MGHYRVGIDVGGTFTHAVALEASTFRLAGHAVVPTTHDAPGEGVVAALQQLLTNSHVSPQQVSFLAYSTTQVTNALLEGDVAPVGIVAIGAGLEGRRAASETRLGDIELAPGRLLPTYHRHLATDRPGEEEARAAVEELQREGAQAVVAAEAFSVDDPGHELLVLEVARQLGLPGTGTHEVSGRYGLRVRTRTAVINASLLPRAIATAEMVERAVREIGITAPLMVVRSDGGVMSIDEMRRRPLLTLLSGPAAGVAAALMYLRVSEGLFLEVGGTSTDISAIRYGRALVRSAEVGGHPLFLRTVDVRTVGIAGGSLPRISGHTVTAVGPRSAHIAGLPYSCFSGGRLLRTGGARAALFSPLPGDPQDYALVATPGGDRVAATVTCAANALGAVPEGDRARGDVAAAQTAFGALGHLLGQSGEEAARAVLSVAARGIAQVAARLADERGMDRETVEVIGGGGGAGALVPAVARELGLPARIAPNSHLISAIGTALALMREVRERTVPNATEADLLQARREVAEALVRAGAVPESVVAEVEYDARTGVLRAVATGQVELRERDPTAAVASDEERLQAAAKSLRASPEQVETVADSALLRAYRVVRRRRRLWGLVGGQQATLALVDQQGVVRLILPGGQARAVEAAAAAAAAGEMLDQLTRYGDAGAELPQVFLGVRGRVVNLSGVATAAQVVALLEAELTGLPPEEVVVLIMAARRE